MAPDGMGRLNGALLQDHGLSHRLIDDPDGRLPAATYLAVQDSVAELLNDPLPGLHLGQQMQPGHFSVLGYLMMNCRCLGEPLHQSARYYQFIGTIFEWRTRFSPTSFTVIACAPSCRRHDTRNCTRSRALRPDLVRPIVQARHRSFAPRGVPGMGIIYVVKVHESP